MLDSTLRPVKDRLFSSVCSLVPSFIEPLHITAAAFISGLASCYFAALGLSTWSVLLWFLNRALDCLDGAVARDRSMTTDLGGFLDLLGDFIVYSLIPICCSLGTHSEKNCDQIESRWVSVAIVEASFHVNNFILFYSAAVIEKQTHIKGAGQKKARNLTSVAMRPALVEGFESAVIFTLMFLWFKWLSIICYVMAVLVGVGIVQRTLWLVKVL